MNGQWHGGKGSKPRKDENRQAYEDNWERIFGNKKSQQNQPLSNEELKKEQAQDRKNG